MAIINGMYVHVTSENVSRDVTSTSHPVESGVPLTDTVKAGALTISLAGKIVGYTGMTAAQVLSKLKSLQNSGSLITYKGRNTASNMQIRNFETDHPNTNSGGADFHLDLVQIRIAKSAYVPKKPSDKAKEQAAKVTVTSKTLKVGMVVVFKGGSVYVSSDAKKAASTRGRSTCTITKISTASYSKHAYHLISKDGVGVYGWVDLANIENTTTTSTSGTTNAGTQQTKTTTTSAKKAVYHKVKKGDTVYALVKKYKTGKSTSWVISNNPKAFSRKGDARTLQIGKKLLMGYK